MLGFVSQNILVIEAVPSVSLISPHYLGTNRLLGPALTRVSQVSRLGIETLAVAIQGLKGTLVPNLNPIGFIVYPLLGIPII